MKMTLGRKISAGLAVVIGIFLVGFGIALKSSQNQLDEFHNLYQNDTRAAALLAKAQDALWRLRYGFPQFLAYADRPDERRKIVDNEPVLYKIVEDALNEYGKGDHSPEQRKMLDELLASYKQYTGARPRWFQLLQEGKVAEAAEWRAKTTTPYGAATVKAFGELLEAEHKEGVATVAELEEGAARVRMATIAVIGLAVGLAVVVGLLIVRMVVRPIGEAVRVADAVAAGDLTVRIDASSKDEMGRMLEALERMRASLASAVGTIRQSAETVGTTSQQIAAGNSELSSRTEEQASSLEETASSMEELTTTVKQNADNAKQANQLAIGASDVAGQGGQVMGEVIQTMGGISEASRKIADIIGVIDGIAFQTNILALNAAVEAARAGEQGRGFAVVASEVRSLAQRSAAAAKEIKELIQNSVERVDGGTRLVEGAGKTMEEIVTSVKRVTDIISEIASASQEQLTGIEQVGGAVTQMDRVVQQNAAIVEESAAAAENMAALGEQLIQAVARFKLDGAAQSAAGRSPVQPAKPAHIAAGAIAPRLERRRPEAAKQVALPEASIAAPKPRTAPKTPGNGEGDWKAF
jgi:methyl-accepting chemotaxis protein